MSIEVKIHQGTGKLTDQALCLSCSHSIIRNETIHCMYYGEDMLIKEKVYKCNKYYNVSLPSRQDMEAIAWELKTTGGRKIGFYPPKKRPDYGPLED